MRLFNLFGIALIFTSIHGFAQGPGPTHPDSTPKCESTIIGAAPEFHLTTLKKASCQKEFTHDCVFIELSDVVIQTAQQDVELLSTLYLKPSLDLFKKAFKMGAKDANGRQLISVDKSALMPLIFLLFIPKDTWPKDYESISTSCLTYNKIEPDPNMDDESYSGHFTITTTFKSDTSSNSTGQKAKSSQTEFIPFDHSVLLQRIEL